MSTPTPEQFLAQTDPEDLEEDAGPVDPLTSIAGSLQQLVAYMSGDLAEAATDVQLSAKEELADLEDKHRALYDLLAQVEKIVAPSTSKLANSVREAIAAWRNPEAPAPAEAPAPVPVENAAEMGLAMPGPDADVETWARYAESLGHEVPGHMNRSQIRTLLGIAQPVSSDG